MGRLIYGTAWKKEQTGELVYCALKEGFRAVSTGAQPENYEEALVASGIRRAIDAGEVSRQDVSVRSPLSSVSSCLPSMGSCLKHTSQWMNSDNSPQIQTTFTPSGAQASKKVVKTNSREDARPGWRCPVTRRAIPGDCPYDPTTSLTEQVHSSVASSLRNFTFAPSSEAAYLDAVILHHPYRAREHTETVWTALSTCVPHSIRHLGISNVDGEELQHLLDFCRENPTTTVRPSIVQNRFLHGHNFDDAVRAICKQDHIEYQAFGVLKESRFLLQDQETVGAVAELAFVSREAALYALVMALQDDMAVLDGTSDVQTMWADIDGVRRIGWSAESLEWKTALQKFKEGIHGCQTAGETMLKL